MSEFKNLGINQPILTALEEMGFQTPTEVQRRAIPTILGQKDVIVISKTGSGKTAAFGIPMLQLIDPTQTGPQGLILTPTRELAVQVDSDIIHMAKHLDHKTTAVYGQHNVNVEVQALQKGADLVTGTPGRVYDHIRHGKLNTKNIRFLVLDEADRMLDMGFFDQVMKIVRSLPKKRQTMLFSATMPPEIRRLVRDYMKDPDTIEIDSDTKTVDTTNQSYYRVERNEKNTQLLRLLTMERPDSCMIFCNMKVTVDRVQTFLTRKGLNAKSLHGDIPQAKRLSTINQFKAGEFSILVTTDVAARGIHIEDLSLVINYDVPVEKDSYVHRIGRTGRAGNSGRAVTLVTSEDQMSLYEIEEHINVMIPESDFPSEEVLQREQPLIDEWLAKNIAPSSGPAAVHGDPTRRLGRSGRPEGRSNRPDGKNQEKRPHDRRSGERHAARAETAHPAPQPAAQAKPQTASSSKPQQVAQPKPYLAEQPTKKASLLQRAIQKLTGVKN